MTDLLSLLVCPACHGQLQLSVESARCDCGTAYEVKDGIPVLFGNPSEHMQRQAAWFDRNADDEWEVERPRRAPALYGWLLEEKFRRGIKGVDLHGATVLAVCAGSGMDAEFLARAGADVVALDISVGAARRATERARRHGFDLLPVVGNVERLPFRDASIDIVFVHDGLHHLEEPLVGLVEMARVARYAVSVTEPARAALTHMAVRFGLALDHEEAGNRVARLAVSDVCSTLTARGFRIVSAERYGMYYRHEPGRVIRLLSAPVLFSLVTLLFRAANSAAGEWVGNKLAIVATRQ